MRRERENQVRIDGRVERTYGGLGTQWFDGRDSMQGLRGWDGIFRRFTNLEFELETE